MKTMKMILAGVLLMLPLLCPSSFIVQVAPCMRERRKGPEALPNGCHKMGTGGAGRGGCPRYPRQ